MYFMFFADEQSFLDEIDTDLSQSVHIPKGNISLFLKLYGGWI